MTARLAPGTSLRLPGLGCDEAPGAPTSRPDHRDGALGALVHQSVALTIPSIKAGRLHPRKALADVAGRLVANLSSEQVRRAGAPPAAPPRGPPQPTYRGP